MHALCSRFAGCADENPEVHERSSPIQVVPAIDGPARSVQFLIGSDCQAKVSDTWCQRHPTEGQCSWQFLIGSDRHYVTVSDR